MTVGVCTFLNFYLLLYEIFKRFPCCPRHKATYTHYDIIPTFRMTGLFHGYNYLHYTYFANTSNLELGIEKIGQYIYA